MHQEEESSHHGVMAQFDNPDDLLAAARATFAAGYRKMDAYSPLPIHGLADAIGYKRTRLPWLAFLYGDYWSNRWILSLLLDVSR